MSNKIDIYHNVLWAAYKGRVFTRLYEYLKMLNEECAVNFFQICNSVENRKGMGSLDISEHQYPYKLLFDLDYQNIPKYKLCIKIFNNVFKSKSKLVIIPGYYSIELWFMWIAAILTGKKIGLFCDSTVYDSNQKFIYTLIKRIFINRCEVYFTYGERSADYLISLGAKKDRIVKRCQAACLPTNYKPSEVINQRKAINPFDFSSPRLLYVGRLSAEKNIPIIISALKELIKKYPNAELILVGLGPEEGELKRLSKLNGCERNIIFLGGLEPIKVYEECLKATCLILPSIKEPWGLVVNEALAYGCPVIVSEYCGCTPEMVIEGVTGYKFNPLDVNSLLESIYKIIEKTQLGYDIHEECVNHAKKFTPEMASHQLYIGFQKYL